MEKPLVTVQVTDKSVILVNTETIWVTHLLINPSLISDYVDD